MSNTQKTESCSVPSHRINQLGGEMSSKFRLSLPQIVYISNRNPLIIREKNRNQNRWHRSRDAILKSRFQRSIKYEHLMRKHPLQRFLHWSDGPIQVNWKVINDFRYKKFQTPRFLISGYTNRINDSLKAKIFVESYRRNVSRTLLHRNSNNNSVSFLTKVKHSFQQNFEFSLLSTDGMASDNSLLKQEKLLPMRTTSAQIFFQRI